MTHLPSKQRSLIPSLFICTLFASLILVGSFAAVPLEAAPDASAFVTDHPTDDPPTLIQHLRAELRSKDAARRQNALLDVIMLSNCQASCKVQFRSIPNKVLRVENESGVGTAIDLDALAPDLITVYRNSRGDAEQLMAFSALINIGNRKALEQLIDDSTVRPSQQSKKVQQATQRGLASYYLNMYPELMDEARRNGNTFTIEDVDRAEARRVKLAKKAKKNDE